MINTLDRLAMIAETKKIEVNIHGAEGNAMRLIGQCGMAMWTAGVRQEISSMFAQEATSGDYTHALRTVDLWVTLVDIAPSGSSGTLIGSLRRLGLAPKPQEALSWRGWD